MSQTIAFETDMISGVQWMREPECVGKKDVTLSSAVSYLVKWHGHQRVVSVNRVVCSFRALYPKGEICERELVALVHKFAQVHGFVAVHDPHGGTRLSDMHIAQRLRPAGVVTLL